MFLLNLILSIGLAFAGVEEAIKREVYNRFGDDVKVQKVKLFTPIEKVEKIELDMEYGRSRAIAYLYSGVERHLAIVEALWRVRVFIALEDIEKGNLINPELFKVEERFMKTVPSDLRLSSQDLPNYIASTRIAKGTLLRRSFLKEVPAVRSGEVVEAIYRSGSVEIILQAIAVDTGHLGKLIRIKRDGKLLRGRVLSRGKVEIVP
ncbi:MAG: flagellar basal body P-ring formation chaperone FlgA [Aquificaceae bacterium]